MVNRIDALFGITEVKVNEEEMREYFEMLDKLIRELNTQFITTKRNSRLNRILSSFIK